MAAIGKDQPSRAAVKDCQWEQRVDATLGLAAWVQHCDYGFRKIDFTTVKNSLAIRYSDGSGQPDPLVDVIDLQGTESIEDGIKRFFAAHTDPAVAKRCVLKSYVAPGQKRPSGVKRYTFLPDAMYKKELDKTSDPNEVGDPACGDWGDMPDGIQYFEAQPESKVPRFLFVRIGQDEPLFDDATLRLLPAGDPAK
ncbi:MAG: hypothetical protein ABI411_05290 [Tahibacter sp.]